MHKIRITVRGQQTLIKYCKVTLISGHPI